MGDDYITLSGRSYEARAIDATVLPYPEPLIQFAKSPKAFGFWWKMMYYAFKFPSPYEFPPPPVIQETDALHRFCDMAKEMASSACLAYGASVGVSVEKDEQGNENEVVTADFPPAELSRGFLVLFRQFYDNHEPASFVNVWNQLGLAAKNAQDFDTTDRLDTLKRWKRAHAKLRANTLNNIVGERMIEDGLWNGSYPDDGRPQELISVFAYGDHIHWGKERRQLTMWKKDGFLGPWHQLKFLKAVAGLAYLYMGFAVLVAGSMGRNDLTLS